MHKIKTGIRRSLLLFIIASGACFSAWATDLTLDGWGKSNCSGFIVTYTVGNRICAQGSGGSQLCSGTVRPPGGPTNFNIKTLSGVYATGEVVGMNGTLLRIPFSCSVDAAGTTLTCGLTNQYTYSRYGSGCTGPSSMYGSLTGPAAQSISIPADATQLTYGANDRAICYRTAVPSAVQCHAVTMSISSLYAGVTSWSIGSPVTVFTANQLDYDGDGTTDDIDTDMDGDGVDNVSDNCPLNANADQADTDADGFPDACTDKDDDNDGVLDGADALPLDPSESVDVDGDGIGDNADTDDDNDGVQDNSDNCLLLANADQLDTDTDGQGNACDTDDDNDGVLDGADALPLDPSESVDTDGDGIGNNADTDDDSDGVQDSGDNCVLVANADQLDTDTDGQGNACDADDDNDGAPDYMDRFPLNYAASADGDYDGFPTSWTAGCDANCQVASGLALDNCPVTANANQQDTDTDGQGDACDTDDDNDGVPDASDSFPLHYAASVDSDDDGFPTSWTAGCDASCQMASGLVLDNCPATANANQQDTDADGQGNACDGDDDNDGFSDEAESLWGTDPLDATSSPDAPTILSFETGVPAGWTKPASANAGWISDASTASHLTKSLRSASIGNGAKAEIEFTANIADSFFTVDVKASTVGNDVFRVYVDNVGVLAVAGEEAWQVHTISVTPGVHTIRFQYWKDGSGAGGLDAVWIDRVIYRDGTDTDADGVANRIDLDDDNDGVPDYIDAEPLNAANATEYVLPVDGQYKGSTVKDQSAVQ